MRKLNKLGLLIYTILFCNVCCLAINTRGNVMINRMMYNLGSMPDIKLLEDGDNAVKYYPVILEIDENKDAEEILNSLEAVVYHSRGSLYLTSIPVNNLDRLPREVQIDNFEMCSNLNPDLDVARMVSRVDDVHRELKIIDSQGASSNMESKVMTGICDIGFDPSHAAFKNCLKQWVIYDEYNGVRNVYTGEDEIFNLAPPTDEVTKTHATHVGNILAGHQLNSPYYGAAPTSDFVATTSRLSEVGICSGIEDIISYAKEVNKKAVVNISAGSYLGPHDGTDLVGRYLSELSKDAVICFSAGNFGSRLNCQSLDLDEFEAPVGSTWCGTDWTGFNVYGGTDFWSKDESAFELRLILWDTNKKEYKFIGDWLGGDGKEGEYFLDLENTPWFTEGGVWVSWGVYPENNRFNFAVEYDYKSEAVQTAGPWANYVVAYHLRKVKENTHVDVYSDGIQSFLHGRGFGVEGSLAGDSDGSISNLACCPDVVAVGAWSDRTEFPNVESGLIDRNIEVNRIANWSAYGKTVDGRRLPHFSAPGNALVSALSNPYDLYEGDKDDANNTACEIDGYKYFVEAGTSMASPMAAGIFALWLEANPDLNVHELVDVAVSTANKDFEDINDPRWGAGAIDAYSGLKKVLELKNNGVGNVALDAETVPFVECRGGKINVSWPGVEHPIVCIFDLAGRELNNGNLSNFVKIVKVKDVESGKEHTMKIY